MSFDKIFDLKATVYFYFYNTYYYYCCVKTLLRHREVRENGIY